MFKTVKVVKAFTPEGGDEIKAGTILQVDDATAKELIEKGCVVVYDKAAEEKAKKQVEDDEKATIQKMTAAIKVSFEKVLKEMAEEKDNRPVIIVGEERRRLDPLGGFKSAGHFFSEVVQASKAARNGGRVPETLARWAETCEAMRQQKVAPAHIMQESDDEQGGYLVPPDIADMFSPPSLEDAISVPRAFNIPVRGSGVKVPALVDATHVGSYYGGVVIYRPGETAAKTPSKPTFRSIELNLHKLVALVPVTDSLIEDSPVSMAALLNNIIPQAIRFAQDEDHLVGTGANQALGAINAANPALVAVPKRAGQVAATITWYNIVDMWARFKMISQSSSVWVCNNDCFPQLACMSMPVGTAGVPVFLPAGGATGKPYATLMGLPLLMTEKCPTVGAQGDIGLIDWSQYYVANKGGIQVASSIHLWFDYDMTAFRFVLRSDGQPAWATPLTPKHSANTLSPFVVTAIRA